MSTGDMTQYMRVKQAERAHPGESKFMRDGFDAWAESNQPARVGQMEKEPAPETSLDSRSSFKTSNMEGAMTVGAARRYRKKMNGGSLFEDLSKSAQEFWTRAIEGAKALQRFYLDATPVLDLLMEELTIVKEDEEAPAEYRKFATEMLQYLNKLNEYRTAIDTIAGGWNTISPLIGMGSGMHGGADQDKNWWLQLSETVGDFASWVIKNKSNFKTMFEQDSMNDGVMQGVGDKIAAAFKFFLGAGRHGGKKHAKVEMHPCNCSGGAKHPVTRSVGRVRAAAKSAEEIAHEGMLEKLGAMGLVRMKHVKNVHLPKPYHGSPITMTHKRRGKGMEEVSTMPYMEGSGMRPSALRRTNPPTNMMPVRRPGPVSEFETYGGRKKAQHRMPDGSMMDGPASVMGGRKKRAPSARGAIVKKVMKEKGLSLPQASKYVKEHGLY